MSTKAQRDPKLGLARAMSTCSRIACLPEFHGLIDLLGRRNQIVRLRGMVFENELVDLVQILDKDYSIHRALDALICDFCSPTSFNVNPRAILSED